jgi:hypothetical protein
MNHGYNERAKIGQVSWLDHEIAEVSLLMPAWHAAQLLTAATAERVTVGQLLRGLVHEYLAQQPVENMHQELESAAH